MGYYTKNGGRIGSGSITDADGVHDVVTSGLFSAQAIYQDILDLTTSLASATVPTPSNLQSVQTIIESANASFNVFAVVGTGDMAENLEGTGVTGGKRTHTAEGFNYNTGTSNILSTGNTIADMEGGNTAGLAVIDGKKWMGMAQFDGSAFDGILLWIFTGDAVHNNGTVTSGTRSVTNVRDIFYPKGTANSNYHHFYPIVIDSAGNVTSNTTSGANGWNFSDGSGANSTTGYSSNSSFSGDDGQWGFLIPGFTDGNGGGTIFTTNGYGIGNQNGGDTSDVKSMWNGSADTNSDFLGFVFSGDAI